LTLGPPALWLTGCALATNYDSYGAGGAINQSPQGGDVTVDAGKKKKDASSSDPDGGAVDAGPAVGAIQVRQTASNHIEKSLTVSATFGSPTLAGSTIIVAIGNEHAKELSIDSIIDDQNNTYADAQAHSVDSACDDAADIRFAANTKAQVKTVTLNMKGTTDPQNQEEEIWILEVTGLSKTSPLDNVAVTNNSDAQTQSLTVTAPTVTPSVPNALVVSTVDHCDAIAGNTGPFTALGIEAGEATAFLITTTNAAAVGAAWNAESKDTFNSSTASFKP
jgi:hypothetical protein